MVAIIIATMIVRHSPGLRRFPIVVMRSRPFSKSWGCCGRARLCRAACMMERSWCISGKSGEVTERSPAGSRSINQSRPHPLVVGTFLRFLGAFKVIYTGEFGSVVDPDSVLNGVALDYSHFPP